MPHPDDFKHYLDCGCRDVSQSLGLQKMPDGYALMLDSDEMYYFGIEKSSGSASASTWDKWAVYRWARKRSGKETG